MHYITEEDLKVYANQANECVHDSMSLYPINSDVLINDFDISLNTKSKKVLLTLFKYLEAV